MTYNESLLVIPLRMIHHLQIRHRINNQNQIHPKLKDKKSTDIFAQNFEFKKKLTEHALKTTPE